MKKLIALSILVSLFAVGVFAQEAEGADAKPPIAISGSAEAAFVPLQLVHSEGDTYVGAGLGRPEDPEEPLVKLAADMNFFESTVGSKVELQFHYGQTHSGAFSFGDFAELWFKPTDWFKMDVGRFNEDRLRGKVGYDNYAVWMVSPFNKDNIFTRFKGEAGVLLSLTPSQVKGLYVGVMVPKFAQFNPFEFDGIQSTNTGGNPDPWRAAQVYKGIQAAIGYDIEGTGLFRIQYVGSKNKNSDPLGLVSYMDEALRTLMPTPPTDPLFAYTPARIEMAFAYTGMDKLVVDFGAKFWFPTSEFVNDIYTNEEYGKTKLNGSLMLPVQVSLGADYTGIENVGIGARIDAFFAGSFSPDGGGSKDVSLPFLINVQLWPSYNLGFGTVGLDFGLEFIGATKMGDTELAKGGINVGFGLWFQKAFGNSSVKLGATYKVGTEMDGKDQPGVLSIPIVFDYSF